MPERRLLRRPQQATCLRWEWWRPGGPTLAPRRVQRQPPVERWQWRLERQQQQERGRLQKRLRQQAPELQGTLGLHVAAKREGV